MSDWPTDPLLIEFKGPREPGFTTSRASVWKRRCAASIVVAAIGGVACESQQPPAACGPMPEVTVNAGEMTTVTACFDDPNEDLLTYSVASANPSVATASMAGTTVTVTAVAPGSVSVTITASDPGGLEGQATLQVLVPNRPPRTLGAIPPIAVPLGRTVSIDVSAYFAEPDGEALTYSVTSSNPRVATVSIAGSGVRVAAVAEGTATVTVTATDPGGLTATLGFPVKVPRRAFRDDFNSAASLDDWAVANASAVVDNGMLELTAQVPGRLAFVGRILEPPITSWSMEARMGLAQVSSSHVALRWYTGHPRGTDAVFLIFNHLSNANYNLQVYDSQRGVWDLVEAGNSTAINDDAGELTTIGISFINGRIRATAGNSELFDVKTTDYGTAVFSEVHGVLLVARYAGAHNSTALFDWIDVAGDAVAAVGDSKMASGSSRTNEIVGTPIEVVAKTLKDTNRSPHLVISPKSRGNRE